MSHNVPVTSIASRPWFGPMVGLLTFVIVLVGGGATAAVVDWGVRSAEMSDLLTQVEASEAAMTVAQEEIAGIAAEFEQIPQPDDADREAYLSEVAAAAGRGRDAVAEAAVGVEGVAIAPWHSAISQAREDYVAHNLAWQAHLDRASSDPNELTVPQDLINSSFEEAEVSFRAAIPTPATDGIQERVDVIFAPAPAEGTQAA